jgi:membrane-bound lytic murein transglycosylase MltF
MIKREEIRILTSLMPGYYYIHEGRQIGAIYEGIQLFDKFLKKRLGKKGKFIKLIIIPVTRDKLIHYLVKGYGDMALANLTWTPERMKHVDFSTPFTTKARELLVRGPKSPPILSLADLSGKEVFVREESSYYESLQTLNAQFRKEGKPEIQIVPAEPRLKDHDILNMLNAGLSPMTVVDDRKYRLWSKIYKNLKAHPDISLRKNGKIGPALRKGTPQFKVLVDEFMEKHKAGTLMGNILIKQHMEYSREARMALQEEPSAKVKELIGLFRTYGKRYGFDPLLLAAFAYQESGFNQKARSRQGAVGIMQVLPSTATSIGVHHIEKLENNIHAGTKYLSILRDTYFSEAKIDPFERMLFAMAGYNAGPNRINRLRKKAPARGLNPDKWFNNVEHIVAASVGREPVTYVGNIYKYYVAYKLGLSQLEEERATRKALGTAQ